MVCRFAVVFAGYTPAANDALRGFKIMPISISIAIPLNNNITSDKRDSRSHCAVLIMIFKDQL